MSILKPDIPHASKYVTVGGHRMHYLEEGKGKTILIVHGIPEWSMLYSGLIKELGKSHRCIVPDHLGFGLSDKDRYADLSPAGHAKRLLAFIDALQLKDIHLVVHDYGGPIGIGALVQQPGLFKSLSISNTWLWSLNDTAAGKGLQMMSGVIGKWLYLNYGFSVKFMAKNGFADKRKYEEVKDIFMYPHQTKEERYANYQLMLHMLQSAAFFSDVLKRLKTLELPVEIIWGMKDKFFDASYLKRWQDELPQASIKEILGVAHFPQVEDTATMGRYQCFL
jgi:pimeloyl-ACP methyl ester carboxylesterase